MAAWSSREYKEGGKGGEREKREDQIKNKKRELLRENKRENNIICEEVLVKKNQTQRGERSSLTSREKREGVGGK